MAPLWGLGFYLVIILNINACSCLAEYEIFPGFGNTNNPVTVASWKRVSFAPHKKVSLTAEPMKKAPVVKHATAKTSHKTVKKKNVTKLAKTTVKMANTTEEVIPYSHYKPFVCPEEEKPQNIGPYEVPTQKDLVVHITKTLFKLFKSYHKKTLLFLNDITKATRATSVIEKNCPIRSKNTYKLCVRHVSQQCQVITKSLVTSLEKQRHDVSTFTEASICNMSSMKADPVQLIKTIAMEEASLEFALPGFLRLLGACSVYCERALTTTHWKKPKRHMSDQDLVIKHFLTRKNYDQLVKGTL